MTKQQFFQSKFKAFDLITVYLKDYDAFYEAYIVGIDFEDRMFKVRMVDSDIWEDEIVDCPIEHATRGHKKKLKIIRNKQ